jgi:prolyl oligopeptidase
MKANFVCTLFLCLSAAALADAARVTPVNPGGAPADLAPRPVTETYFGQKVVDPYRYVEAKDADTIAWMKAQAAWTRSVFDSIAPRAEYLRQASAFGGAFGIDNSVQIAGTRVFYLERAPGSDVFDLVVREADGAKRMLVDTAALIKAAKGVPQAIDYYTPSPDGKQVAVGISAGGSENSSVTVRDVASGRIVAGPLDRAEFGGVSWLDDGSGLFVIRLQELRQGAKPTDKYLNSSCWFWNFKDPPRAVAGPGSGLGPVKDPQKAAPVQVILGTGQSILVGQNGVQNEVESWLAPVNLARTGQANWRPLSVTADDVTGIDADTKRLYFLTHKDAPTFKVLSMPYDGTLATAQTLIPADPKRVIESIHAAQDALYVVAREGLNGKVLRVAADGKVSELPLPFAGTVGEVATTIDHPGAIVALVGWVHPQTHFRYDPASGRFTDLHMNTGPAFDAAHFAATESQARAKDGTQIPMSVITTAGPVQLRPTLLDAYGSYGISILPNFSPRIIEFVRAGGTYVECHVRGGGELGDAWRLGGKDAKKPNTWRDFIACAEELIAKGYTKPELLTISGGSAGGVTVGRAATERPDLFAGAVGRVPDVNSLRAETMPSGPANIPEFGTVKDEQGFKNLYAMDSYQHVDDKKRYPAFLLTTGLNDPRVEPWEPAKMAARLMQLPDHAPVLLRVEGAAGHGMGTTKSTRDAEEADIAAFVFWRAGVPDWQPKK